jgi:hypothetical protein
MHRKTLCVAAAAALLSWSFPHAADIELRRVSAKESAHRPRSGALVRMPLVLDDEEGIQDVQHLRVYSAGASMEFQATDIVKYPSGNVRGCNLYIPDDFEKRQEKLYMIMKAATAVAPSGSLTVNETDEVIMVQGEDITLEFYKNTDSHPGTIKSIQSSKGKIEVTSPLGPSARIERVNQQGTSTSTETFDNTAKSQRNVGITVENGPLFARVHIKNQQMKNGNPIDVFQYVTYTIPREKSFFKQIVEYDCDDPKYGASVGVTNGNMLGKPQEFYSLKGGLYLGSSSGKDEVFAFDNGVFGASANPGNGDKKKAIRNTTAKVAFIPVGATIRDFQDLERSGNNVAVLGSVAHFSDCGHNCLGLIHKYNWAKDTHLYRTYFTYIVHDQTSNEALNTISVEHANPVVGIVDKMDASFDKDIAPLIKKLNDHYRSVSKWGWTEMALANYVNWNITGDKSYKTAGDNIVNSKAGTYGPHMGAVYLWSNNRKLAETARNTGAGKKNSKGFVHSHGYNCLETHSGKSSLINFDSEETADAVFGTKVVGDKGVYDWYKNWWQDPIMQPNLNHKVLPYWKVYSNKYITVQNNLMHYTYLSIHEIKFVEYWSEGDIAIDDAIFRQFFESVDIDIGTKGEDASGWPNYSRVTKNQRHLWSSHGMGWAIGMMLMEQERENPIWGIGTMKRILERYMNLKKGTYIGETINPDCDRKWLGMLPGTKIQETQWRDIPDILRGINPGITYCKTIKHPKPVDIVPQGMVIKKDAMISIAGNRLQVIVPRGQQGTLVMYDLDGTVVRRHSLSGKTDWNINLSRLATGIYVCEYQGENKNAPVHRIKTSVVQ